MDLEKLALSTLIGGQRYLYNEVSKSSCQPAGMSVVVTCRIVDHVDDESYSSQLIQHFGDEL